MKKIDYYACVTVRVGKHPGWVSIPREIADRLGLKNFQRVKLTVTGSTGSYSADLEAINRTDFYIPLRHMARRLVQPGYVVRLTVETMEETSADQVIPSIAMAA